MLLIAKLIVFLNNLFSMGFWEFRTVRRGDPTPSGWELAHHEIKGRNGGMLLVPRNGGLVWPQFLGRRFRLLVRRPGGRR